MSKAVLISIRPEWCEKIINGRKNIEVRKTRPKMDTPFKCYIYRSVQGGVISQDLLRPDNSQYILVCQQLCASEALR